MQCIAIRLKYAHSLVDIGNHRYTYVQNCILLKYKKKMCAASPRTPPPPHPKNVPTALLSDPDDHIVWSGVNYRMVD